MAPHEEPPNHHETPGRQIKQSIQLSLPHHKPVTNPTGSCEFQKDHDQANFMQKLFPSYVFVILEFRNFRTITVYRRISCYNF